jgi:hypothetical protein
VAIESGYHSEVLSDLRGAHGLLSARRLDAEEEGAEHVGPTLVVHPFAEPQRLTKRLTRLVTPIAAPTLHTVQSPKHGIVRSQATSLSHQDERAAMVASGSAPAGLL